jgi:SAM-dependent methyltransferase
LNEGSFACPVCGDSGVLDLGPISVQTGVIRLANPGRIYQCDLCGMLFRRPYLSSAILIETYGTFSVDCWRYPQRTDFDLAAQIIRSVWSAGRVLDVGCYRGDFLATLPDGYQKYGIEPAEAAREVARSRGITLLGAFIEEPDINAPLFHVITLLDVIEHLPYPLESLKKVARRLLPGGLLIVSTGNTDALPWRLMRQDYWYYCTEHVSFFNPKWFRWAAQQLDLSFVGVKRFSHQEGSVLERWRQFAQCLTFITLKNLDCYPLLKKMISRIYPFNRAIRWTTPPLTRLWKDHLLVTLQSRRLNF